MSGSSHLDGKSRKTALRGWSHVTRKMGSAELRRGIAESRRVKPENLCGSQRILGGSLRNNKKCKKQGGWVTISPI